MVDPAQRSSVILRTVRVSAVAAELFLLHPLNSHRSQNLGTRLREACERLGLVSIKIGQILSTRYDLLGRENCEELQKLLDMVPPFPRAEVERIFQEDFGHLPEELFEDFDWAPIASASISQVYRATLRGEKVAVKVRRPGVTANLRVDARIISWLARVGGLFSRKLRRIDMDQIMHQAEAWMQDEADFLNEAANIEAVDGYYDSGVRQRIGPQAEAITFPKPQRECCSRNVLTMQFLEGVVAKDFQSVKDDPRYDAQASLYNLVRAVLRSCLTEDEFYFHGDPHPSNILIMPNGKVGLLDLGLLGRLDRRDMHLVRDLLLAVYVQDANRTAALLAEFCRVPADKYDKLIQQDLPAYFEKTRRTGLGFWLSGVIDITFRHGMPLPYDFILFGRMYTIIDGLFTTVVPGKTTIDILGEELDYALQRRIFDNLSHLELLPALYVLTEGLRTMPAKLPILIERYANDPLQLIRDVSNAIQGKERAGV